MKIRGFEELSGRIVQINARIRQLVINAIAGVNPLEIYNSDGELIEKVDENGFKSIRYRDEYVGGEWVNPTGGTPPDDVSVTIGGVLFRMKAFDGNNTTEWFANSFEMAHDLAFDEINSGTVKIEVHVHFMPSNNNAGAVKWFFDWAYLPAGGAPIPMTTVSFINTFGIDRQYNHMLAGVELPVPAGGYGIGDIILFNIRRTPTDPDDNYPSDALFLKCALHVPTNDFGSRQRYIK